MPAETIHACQCGPCSRGEAHPERERHYQTNLFLSRLDEDQRRWYLALESQRMGWGADRLLMEISGVDEKTIRRGREELAASLVNRPADRVRQPGAGRPPVEKNALDLVGPRGVGCPGNGWRPDDGAEVGPQQSAHAERQVRGGRSRGQSAHGEPPAAQARLLAARQCKKDRSLVESPRPWAAVRLHCCTTRDVHCGWAADHQYRLQEKRARGRLQERRPDLVARADRRQ